jgi:hypothetical protein
MMIVSNAVFIGVQTDLAATGIATERHAVLTGISCFYTVVFAVEIVLRVAACRMAFFIGQAKYWNLLDFFVVIISIGEAVVDFSLKANASEGAMQGPVQFRIVRLLRITKIIKLIRITRIMRLVRALRTLVHQIMSALKSLGWALLLLFIVIFFVRDHVHTGHHLAPLDV